MLYTKKELSEMATKTSDLETFQKFKAGVLSMTTNTPSDKEDVEELVVFLQSLKSKETSIFIDKVIKHRV